MDEIVSKIAGFGVSGLILMIAIKATGLTGAAALTLALSSIGPGGIFYGVLSLVLISLITEAFAKYGFECTFKAVVLELYRRGETKESLLEKIENYWITPGMKLKLEAALASI